MTPEEVLAELEIFEPVPVAWVSKDGTKRDDDGNAIDERETVRSVTALGPFGSWPETLESAVGNIRSHAEWWEGESFRVGRAAVWKQGWGYSLKEKS